jgi:leucyl aminopeptidase
MLLVNSKKKFPVLSFLLPKKLHAINDKDSFIFNKESIIFYLEEKIALEDFIFSIKNFLLKNKINFELNIDNIMSHPLFSNNIMNVVTLIDMIEEFYDNTVNFKTDSEKKTVEVNLVFSRKYKDLIEKHLEISKEKTFVRKLQDLPSNIINPVTMLEQIKKQYGNIPGLKISSLSQKELIKKGMNLMVGVNLGSDIDCQLVVLEYNGNPKSKEKIAYVGKGVCFDSGGYSLKRSLIGMKYDMSGAAIVCSAVALAAKQKVNANLVAVAGLVINRISEKAQLVDDVITSYSGKTVEIGNTDAEGRLVLADCITYAIKDKKATKILDVATLTGAIVSALGDTYSGVWSTIDSDFETMKEIASRNNEFIWRMPFNNNWTRQMNSKIADIYNIDYSGKAGSCTAAAFLQIFAEDKPFIHIDIAGTAGFEGRGRAPLLRTLIDFAENIN